MGKRAFDIAFATASLLILAVPMVLIACAVAIKHGRPVIFTQQRMGQSKKPFNIYKFRSMTNECDENGALLPDENRITKFGWLLRRTSVDELPQLFNILKGEMSIVGPRPMPVVVAQSIGKEFDARYSVPQGLTGLAQISVRRQRDNSLRKDLEYVEKHSAAMDLKIILKTFNAVAHGEGTGIKPQVPSQTPPKQHVSPSNDINLN